MDGSSRLSVIARFVVLVALIATSLLFTPAQQTAATAATPSTSYWIANAKGQVWNFGGAANYGDLTGKVLNKPIVGITPTVTNKGYWLVATDGGIFSFGDAAFYGSTGALKLNKPIVGMAPPPSGKGYWMVASDGGIFSFGDAAFFGSTGALKLNQPIVAMEATPTNKGYWLVATDGGIFSFGDAAFYGSTGALKLVKPIIGMETSPTGRGYWLVASDGGIFTFGDAKFLGSGGASGSNNFSRMVSTTDGKGYWLIRNGGDAMGFGTAVGSNGAQNATATETRIPTFALLYNITGPGDLAVLFGLGERGKPYLWGGNGPSAYDCSGLTVAAWKQGGVNLPRIAADQYNVGTRVPLDQAQPGDLVFWGSNATDSRSIYHVAIYVGANSVVTAPKSNDIVRTSPIWTTELMPFAVRVR